MGMGGRAEATKDLSEGRVSHLVECEVRVVLATARATARTARPPATSEGALRGRGRHRRGLIASVRHSAVPRVKEVIERPRTEGGVGLVLLAAQPTELLLPKPGRAVVH